MRKVFDIYTIIFLALAVFIFLRLRNVLGQRTGREPPPPYSAREVRTNSAEKVVALPGRTADAAPPRAVEDEPVASWTGIAEPGSDLAKAFDALRREDPSFDPEVFLGGARSAYEMIVTAFTNGDRKSLKNLLSADVYEGFETAIKERERRNERVETRFVSIDDAKLTAAELRNKTAQVTVRFVSQLVTVTRDAAGQVIDGNPDKVTEVTDVWTFARDLSSRDPNWKLIATETGH